MDNLSVSLLRHSHRFRDVMQELLVKYDASSRASSLSSLASQNFVQSTVMEICPFCKKTVWEGDMMRLTGGWTAPYNSSCNECFYFINDSSDDENE